MPEEQTQMFGGDWTQEKLDMLRRYLVAYTTALKKTPFELVYIDAFAGTGYRELKAEPNDTDLLLPDVADQDAQRFLEGSAAIALDVKPPFHSFIFVEKSTKRMAELEKLKDKYCPIAPRIELINGDCNIYLQDMCRSVDWRSRRAVLFLDPFGMQVDWDTMKAVASTRAIDVWVLFPLVMGVNRLLRRDGQIPDSWRTRLDRLFGEPDWYSVFYKEKVAKDLLGEKTEILKCDLETISKYYNDRLRSIFAAVADNPRRLCHPTGRPLYLLCFAVGNPRGKDIAIRIAQHILKG